MSKLEKRRDSDGRIRFSFRYIDVDGTRKRHTPDVDTEHEALRIMAEVRARIARGIVGVPDVTANERQASTITLSAMLDRWLNLRGESRPSVRHRTRCGTDLRLQGLLPHCCAGRLARIRRSEAAGSYVRPIEAVVALDHGEIPLAFGRELRGSWTRAGIGGDRRSLRAQRGSHSPAA